VLAALSAACGGCAGLKTVVLPDRTRQGNVYFFAGIMDFGAGSMRQVAGRLAADGYNAQWISHAQTEKLARELTRAHDAGELTGPIVLVGYSMGGTKATDVARRLEAHHMTVDAIVVVDGFPMSKIPRNVRSCYNIYKGGVPPLCIAGTVTGESESTEVVNVDIVESDIAALHGVEITHWNITHFDAMKDLIDQAVRRYLPAAPTTSQPHAAATPAIRRSGLQPRPAPAFPPRRAAGAFCRSL
jgi:hypothetical protein